MNFKIGEKVVYPNHGIGVIENITSTEIGGSSNSFYLLRLKATESTVMVPINNASDIGLRSPIKAVQCEKLLQTLSEDFSNPPVDWKDRYKEFTQKMKTGDIFLLWRARQLAEAGKVEIHGEPAKGWKEFEMRLKSNAPVEAVTEETGTGTV